MRRLDVADCDANHPGCETTLGSDTNCGSCNDPSCTLANTMFTCSDGLGCTASVCEVGFANCNTSSPDCETAVASTTPTSGGCLPQYVGSVGLATQLLNFTVTALAADGSFFIAGTYQGTVDFDPSSTGKDIRTATDADGYVSKFNADGSYAWTATLGGRGGLSLAAAGGHAGRRCGRDRLVPGHDRSRSERGAGHPGHQRPLPERHLRRRRSPPTDRRSGAAPSPGTSFDSEQRRATGIAVDAAGAVYVAGFFSGTVDFDPGAGTDTHSTHG